MPRIGAGLFLLILLVSPMRGWEHGAAASVVTLYVAPDGNDSWTGKLASPNASQTDGPFATFDHARAVVRTINKSGVAQIDVQFRGGTYALTQTLNFTSADSGTPSTEIVYQNYRDEKPVFSGGIRVSNWTRESGNTWKSTLPASTQYFENLFYNGTRRLRPRLGGYLGPYLRFAGPVYTSSQQTNCTVEVNPGQWECFDRFQYNSSDPISDAWKNLAPASGNPCNQTAGDSAIAGDIEIIDWEQFSTPRLRVSCVDAANHIVYLTGRTGINQATPSQDGFIAGNRYLVENVQDALTQPGQWFLDRSASPWTLTYLANPEENPNTGEVIVPQVAQLLIASNLQYVTFRGLTFEHDNYTVPPAGHPSEELEPDVTAAVSFQNSQHVTFDSGTVAHISGVGLEFISCINATSPAWCVSNSLNAATANDAIENSAFYDLGSLGIRIGDPYAPADTDANVPYSMTVRNNLVEGYGRIIPASFGIGQGVGHDNLYTHNTVYDGYHCAISISMSSGDTVRPSGIGNANNTISFNHVHDLLKGIMNDGGSIRIEAGDEVYTAPGNKILNNKIHDVTDASIMDSNGYGGDGIYLDNQTGLVDVENNLVYRVSGNTVYTPQGPAAPDEANIVKNNILAFGRQSMVAINSPYPYGVPASPNQNFIVTNNLFLFDRDNTSSPKFWVQGGCIYSAGFPYPEFQEWDHNMYWRMDGGFATDKKAFAVQTVAGTGTNNNAPCSANTNNWTFYTFAGWQQTVNEDAGSLIENPGFAKPPYPFDDYSLPAGSPGVGFVLFDACEAGVIQRPGDGLPFRVDKGRPCELDREDPAPAPPSVPETFPTQMYNPAADY